MGLFSTRRLAASTSVAHPKQQLVDSTRDGRSAKDSGSSTPHAAIKCVVVGDAGVGKTSMIRSHLTGQMPRDHELPFISSAVHVPTSSGTLTMWDTSGHKDEDLLRPLTYASCDVFIVAFSLGSKRSLQHARSRWVPEVRAARPKATIVLCGCQLDQRDSSRDPPVRAGRASQVGEDEARRTARELGCAYTECSALTTEGLRDVFELSAAQGTRAQAQATGRWGKYMQRLRAFFKIGRGPSRYQAFA